MNQLIEIARFQTQSEADTARCLLESEGIQCFFKDELMSQVYGNIGAFGGIKLEVPQEDLPLALEVIKKGGYEKYLSINEYPEGLKSFSSLSEKIPFLKKYPLEKQIIIVLLAVAVVFGLLIFATYYL